jgi:hypothetical protein
MSNKLPISEALSAIECRVETTLRGGYFIRVALACQGWTGLYQLGQSLVLVARCAGAPPVEIPLSHELRAMLLTLVDAAGAE